MRLVLAFFYQPRCTLKRRTSRLIVSLYSTSRLVSSLSLLPTSSPLTPVCIVLPFIHIGAAGETSTVLFNRIFDVAVAAFHSFTRTAAATAIDRGSAATKSREVVTLGAAVAALSALCRTDPDDVTLAVLNAFGGGKKWLGAASMYLHVCLATCAAFTDRTGQICARGAMRRQVSVICSLTLRLFLPTHSHALRSLLPTPLFLFLLPLPPPTPGELGHDGNVAKSARAMANRIQRSVLARTSVWHRKESILNGI